MSSFKFSIPVEVRFRDLDALGHVNNAVYLTYFEIARTHYWKYLFGIQSFEEFDYLVVRAECNYRSPALFGETLKVAGRISALKTSSFVFEYEVTESRSERLIADGQTVQACFDLKEKKTIPVPAELRRRVIEFEGLTE
ncbi:MAG: acyl-CoA thioesterase [Acidobacteria bacterium]|nr:MAG: acyl-CoA thioesterase [Acidobacteriota bacterium]